MCVIYSFPKFRDTERFLLWFTTVGSECYFPIIFATVCTCWEDVELMQESLSFYPVRIKQSGVERGAAVSCLPDVDLVL